MLSNPAAASRITPIFLFSNSSSLLTGAVEVKSMRRNDRSAANVSIPALAVQMTAGATYVTICPLGAANNTAPSSSVSTSV